VRIIAKVSDRSKFPDVGEYVECTGENGRRIFYTRCPECEEIISIDTLTHKVTFDDQGQMTVCPSVMCPMAECTFHGWIENGQLIGA